MDDLQREIDRIEKRTRRYWFDDGLAEIATGAGFLVVALYFVISRAFEGRAPNVVLNLALPVLVIVVAFAGRHAIRLAKDRYVHPRTGYVSFDRPPRNRLANAALGFVIALVLALLASRADALHDWIPALTGLTLAVGFLLFGRQAGMLRFPLAGSSCVVVGVLLSVVRVHENLAAGLLFGWAGLVLIAGGIVALLAYMRHAPLAPPDSRAPGDGAEEEA